MSLAGRFPRVGPAVRWLKDIVAHGICLMILLWPVDRWLFHLSAPVCLHRRRRGPRERGPPFPERVAGVIDDIERVARLTGAQPSDARHALAGAQRRSEPHAREIYGSGSGGTRPGRNANAGQTFGLRAIPSAKKSAGGPRPRVDCGGSDCLGNRRRPLRQRARPRE
jgi:hypothetical protein